MTARPFPARVRAGIAAVAAVLVGLGLVGCGGSAGSAAGTAPLTLYSGQHEALAKDLVAAFAKKTGIKINVRAGEDVDLVNQLMTEGAKTKADLFITEQPGPLDQLAAKGLLAKVDASTLKETDTAYNPSDGMWVAWAARARVIVYDPAEITPAQLPQSVLALSDPAWKGKFGYAPSGAFLDTVTYLINTIGEARTKAWLEGVKANGKNLGSNSAVRDAVEAGQVPFGLTNHYYWYLLAAQQGGPDKLKSKLYDIGNGDAGSLVFASGGAVLKASKHQQEAQRFLAWLASADGGQRIVADDSPQYPLAPGVKSTTPLTPLAQIDAPKVDQGSFANLTATEKLVTSVGMI